MFLNNLKFLANIEDLENSIWWPYPAQLDVDSHKHNLLRKIVASGAIVCDIGSRDEKWRSTCESIGAKYISLDFEDWKQNYESNIRKVLFVSPDIYGDCRNIGLKNQSIDCMLCFDVLEHIDDPLKALTEMIQTLAIGGKLIVTVPWMLELHGGPNADDDWFRYSPRALSTMAFRAGARSTEVSLLGGFGSSLSTVVSGFFIRNLEYRLGIAKILWVVVAVVVIMLVKSLRVKLDQLDRASRNPTVIQIIISV